MAESDSDMFSGNCGFCKKPAKNKKLQCSNCMQIFHTSCSSKKSWKCCDKQSYSEEKMLQPSEDIESENLSDSSIDKSVASENRILKEINSDLRVNIKQLKEKILNLEMDNLDLKEALSKKQDKILTTQEDITRIISETIKIELQNSVKSFKSEINSLNQRINKLSDINLKNTTKNHKHILSSTEKPLSTSTLKTSDKIPVSPKQCSPQLITASPNQNQNVFTPLEQQQKIMNELIHLESDKTLYNTHENLTIENAGRETENWQTVQKRKKSFKRNIGQSEGSNEKFTSVKPKVWLYLYRIAPEVMEEDIKQYLITKTSNKNEDFIVKDLNEPGRTRFKNFMVAADFQYKELFYQPSFWPKGVFFRRFDFNKHFEKYKTRHIFNNENGVRPNSFLVDTSQKTVQSK